MRKTALVALAATTVLLASTAFAQQQVDWDKIQIKTTDLGHNTYMLEGQGGNITVAVGTDGIIMVDTQFAPLSDKIKAAIKAISPLPIKYIINTHFHGDHTGGNANFQKDGATVIAQDNIRLRLAAGGNKNGTTGNATAARASGDACRRRPTPAAPRRSKSAAARRYSHHVYNAHTDGDTWVYFDDANVLCHRRRHEQPPSLPTGRLRQWRRHPRHDPGDQRLAEVANDNTKIVVGHGPLANKATSPSTTRW